MKNKILTTVQIVVYIAISNILAGQTEIIDSSKVFNLEELKEYAITHNYELLNAELEIDKSKAIKWETTAIGLPQVNGQINFQTFPQIPTTLIPGEIFGAPGTVQEVQFGTEHNADWGVTVSQLIFSGEYIVGLKASRIYLELSKKAKEKSTISVKENIEKTYFLILITEESIKVLDSILHTTQLLLADNEKLAEAGFLEETDLEQIKLNLKSTESSKISFEKQRDILYRLLKFQAGINYNTSIQIDGNLDDIISEMEENTLFLEEFVLFDNIDYQIMQVQENLADLSLQREKTKYLPTLSAFYSYQQSFMNDSLNFFANDAPWYGTSLWGLQLNIPIFSSGSRYAKVKQAQFELDESRNLRLQTEQAIMLEYQQTVSEFLISLNTVKNNSEQRHLANKIYKNSIKKFKLGVQESYVLSQHQAQYFVSLTNYYSALNELIDKYITLKRLMNNL